jgi:hypothetical protein
VDKKAVSILFNKYWSSAGWKTDQLISNEDFEYAKSKNVMFDNLLINHEQTVSWLLEMFNNTSKTHIVKCFISSLSTKQLDLRSGLSCYAFARNFPKHYFSFGSNFCKICGLYKRKKQETDINILNFERLKWGGVRLTDPVYIAWNLQMLNNEATPEPNDEDIAILNQMIRTINQCDELERPNQLEKKFAMILKSNSNERRVIIDMLGICGILETKTYKGFFENFIPVNKRAVRPVNKTDWEYPVDWWTGKDGINKDALDFYFGEYLR